MIVKGSRFRDVAASFRDEDGDLQSACIRDKLVVAGPLERRPSTPFVNIEREEICSFCRVIAASQVVLKHRPKVWDVSCAVIVSMETRIIRSR